MVVTGPQKQEATFWVSAAGFVTFFFFFWLVGGEAAGLCSRNLVFSLKLPSSTWVGAPVLQMNSKTLLCIFLWVGTRTLSGGCTTIWLFLLFLYPLPSLISNCLNPLFGTQGRSRRLNDTYILQTRNGEYRTDLYSRALQSPAQF